MALQKQLVGIDLTKSLDARTGNKLVLAGKLTTAQDIIWRGKVVERRTGYTAISNAIASGGFLSAETMLKGYEYNGQLLAQGQSLYGYSSQGAAWTRVGSSSLLVSRGFPLNTVTKTPIVRGPVTALMGDLDNLSGYTVYAWLQLQNTAYTISVLVIDEATGAIVLGPSILSITPDTVTFPRVVAFNNTAMVLWREASNIKFSILSLTSISSGWSVAANVVACNANSVLDARTVSGQTRCFFIYSDATPNIQISEINSSGAVVTGPTSTALGVTFINGQDAWLGTSSNNFLFVVATVAGGTNQYQRVILNFSLTVTSAAANVAGYTPGTLLLVSLASIPNTSSCDIYFSTTGGDVNNSTISKRVLNSDGTFGPLLTFMFGHVPVSNPFTYQGRRYLWVLSAWGMVNGVTSTPSVLDPSVTLNRGYFLVEDTFATSGTSSFAVAGKALYQVAALPASVGSGAVFPPPKVVSPSGIPFTIAFEQGSFFLLGGAFTGLNSAGFDKLIVQPHSSAPLTKASLGNMVVQASAVPSIYDGQSPVELGFLQYPEMLALAASGADGALGTGQYQYAVTYEWYSAVGERFQSAPTPAVAITPAATNHVTVSIPTLRMSNMIQSDGLGFTPRLAPRIVVWRTVSGGSILFRRTSISTSIVNPSGDITTFTDTAADSQINSNEILYTAGALANIAPPPSQFAIAHQNRIFLSSSEDGNLWWFSRKYVLGNGINFNDALSFRSTPWGGRDTGGASMDDKFIGFQRTAIWWMAGDGPNDLGSNNSFSQPFLLTKETGCIDGRSIVTTPFGIVFLSLKGFYLLDRGLQLSYLGAPEGIVNPPFGAAALAITSGVLLTKKNQIRWTTGDGRCLVMDYTDLLANDANEPPADKIKWSIFGNYSSNDAVIWQDAYTTVGTDSAICQDSDAVFADNRNVGGVLTTTGITGLGETGWIKVAAVQGFQRVYWIYLIGDTQNAVHSLNLTLFNDFTGQASETLGPIVLPITTSWQVRHKPVIQKGQALKIRFSMSSEQVTPWNLQNIDLEVGIHAGKGFRGLSPGQTI